MTDIERLKILRKSLNLQQGEFASSVGLKQGSYSDVERGRSGITYTLLQSICMLYNVNPSWILFGTEPMILSEKSTPKSTPTGIPNCIPTGIPNPETVSMAAEGPTHYESAKSAQDIPLSQLAEQFKQMVLRIEEEMTALKRRQDSIESSINKKSP